MVYRRKEHKKEFVVENGIKVRLFKCKFCGGLSPASEAYVHLGDWVCEHCWDERLRITE